MFIHAIIMGINNSKNVDYCTRYKCHIDGFMKHEFNVSPLYYTMLKCFSGVILYAIYESPKRVFIVIQYVTDGKKYDSIEILECRENRKIMTREILLKLLRDKPHHDISQIADRVDYNKKIYKKAFELYPDKGTPIKLTTVKHMIHDEFSMYMTYGPMPSSES